MEPSGVAPKLSLPEKLRRGQRAVIEAFASREEVIAKLPTGYGKTLAAAGSYAVLRSRETCDRMLYIVPRTSQARQACEALPKELLSSFDILTNAIDVSRHHMPAYRAHLQGKAEIFVTTVQALNSSPSTARTVSDLMQTGRWFVVVDEHHHYGNEGAWAEQIKALPHKALLAMSATPNRGDQSDHFGTPHISESYREAADAKCVKPLLLHSYEYVVDAITIDGRTISFTTEQVVQAAGSDSPEDIDKYLASARMRWDGKYIRPLVSYPLDRIIDLRTRGIYAQVLVQAMSCSHASMVCDQIRDLLPEGMSVDWVGTGPYGRSDKENESVLADFCPPKDPITGMRDWGLDVLVNVGMASEGLDTTDVTEIVFLTPANITISNLQTIGRGARVMQAPNTVCHVNVDTCSPMAKHLGDAVMDLFEDESSHKPKPRQPTTEPSDYEPLPDRLQVVLLDVRLAEIHTGGFAKYLRQQYPEWSQEMADHAAAYALKKYFDRANNMSATLAQKRDQVNNAVSKIAGLALRRSGPRIEGAQVGRLCHLINSRKKNLLGRVEDASDEELDTHFRWVKDLEQQILKQGVPAWLR